MNSNHFIEFYRYQLPLYIINVTCLIDYILINQHIDYRNIYIYYIHHEQ